LQGCAGWPYILRETCEEAIVRLIVNWILSAIAVWVVAQIVPGVSVSGPMAALIAALAIGFVNATIGLLLKVLTFPLTLVTFGLFWLVINALMLKLAAALVPGFRVQGFLPAFIGAILLSVVNMVLKWLVFPEREQ
jgi:putative membrane protein